MKIVFDCEETEEQALQAYHTLMGALMLRMVSSVGIRPVKQREVSTSDSGVKCDQASQTERGEQLVIQVSSVIRPVKQREVSS